MTLVTSDSFVSFGSTDPTPPPPCGSLSGDAELRPPAQVASPQWIGFLSNFRARWLRIALFALGTVTEVRGLAKPVQISSGGKYAFLDGLRGWAAVWVTLNHLQHNLPDAMASMPTLLREAFITQGGMGVIVFFTLSGYVITRSISRGLDAPGFGNFYLRRLVRLTPPYYGSIVVALVIHYVSTQAKDEQFVAPTLVSWLAHLVYLPVVFGQEVIVGVHWTLYLEMQFYLMIGLLMWVFATGRVKSRPALRTAILTTLALAALIWPLFDLLDDFQPHFLPYVSSFLGGCFIFWRRTDVLPQWLFFGYGAALAVAAALYRNPTYVTTAIAFWFLWWACGQPQVLARWLSDRVSQFFGHISFSLYLTHSSVLGATYYLGSRAVGEGESAQWLLIAPQLAVAIFCGYVFYRVVEVPALQWSKGLRRSITPAAAA